jgi:hypothetical protein
LKAKPTLLILLCLAFTTYNGSGEEPALAQVPTTTTITTINHPPTADSLTPVNITTALGTDQTFTLVLSDPDGWQDIAAANLYLSGGGGSQNDWLHYLGAPNLFTMMGSNDFCSPGQAKTLSSGYLILNCVASSVSGSGNALTVMFNVTPQPSFAGVMYNLFFSVSDQGGGADAKYGGTWFVSASTTMTSTTTTTTSTTSTTTTSTTTTTISTITTTTTSTTTITTSTTTTTSTSTTTTTQPLSVSQLAGTWNYTASIFINFSPYGCGGVIVGTAQLDGNGQGTFTEVDHYCIGGGHQDRNRMGTITATVDETGAVTFIMTFSPSQEILFGGDPLAYLITLVMHVSQDLNTMVFGLDIPGPNIPSNEIFEAGTFIRQR